MSSRKPMGSNSKVPPKKASNSSRKVISFNSTMLGSIVSPHVGLHTNLNSTMQHTSMHLNSPLVPVVDDTDIECELAYSKYLQALMKKQILEKVIDSHDVKCNDQLDIQREVLIQLQKEENHLEAEIEMKNIMIEMQRNFIELSKSVDKCIGPLNENLLNDVENFINILNIESNKLYTKHIVPLKNQEDYEKFENLLHCTQTKLDNFLTLCGDYNGIQALAKKLNDNLKLQEEVMRRNKFTSDLQHKAVALTLEQSSDMFANSADVTFKLD